MSEVKKHRDPVTRMPLIVTKLTPEEIVGDDNMPLLEIHFKKAIKCVTTEEHEKVLSKMSDSDRKHIADILQKLRDHGYYPHHQNKVNTIIFWTPRLSDVQQLVDSFPLPNMGEFRKELYHELL